MLSKTFSSSKTIFLKNLRQYWPLWGSYLLILLISGPIALYDEFRWDYYSGNNWEFFRNIVSHATTVGTTVVILYSILSAIAVFSFLYNLKSSGFYTSLPTTRLSLFTTQYISGLVWLIGSNFITALAFLLVQAMTRNVNLFIILQWFGITSLTALFFYSFGTLCCVLTGHSMVPFPLFFVLNLCVVVVEYFLKHIISELVYGISISTSLKLSFFSPIYNLYMYSVGYEYSATDKFSDAESVIVGIHYDGWPVLIIYAIIAIVITVGAFYIFKKRHMETAGDVVAVNVLKPAFRYCMAFGCALVGGCTLYAMFYYFASLPALPLCLYMLISSFIGFFGSDMLIEKSFRVFRKRRWAEFSAISALIIFFVIGAETDIFNIEKYIPDSSKIDTVEITCRKFYSTDNDDTIEDIRTLHSKIIDNKSYYESKHGFDQGYYLKNILGLSGILTDENEKLFYSLPEYSLTSQDITIIYNLKNGRTITREYCVMISLKEIETEGTVGFFIDKIINSTDAVKQRYNIPEKLLSSADYVYNTVSYYPAEGENSIDFAFTLDQLRTLYETCIIPDIEAGLIGKTELAYNWDKDSELYPNIWFDIDLSSNSEKHTYVYFSIDNPESKTFQYIESFAIRYSESDNVNNVIAEMKT